MKAKKILFILSIFVMAMGLFFVENKSLKL